MASLDTIVGFVLYFTEGGYSSTSSTSGCRAPWVFVRTLSGGRACTRRDHLLPEKKQHAKRTNFQRRTKRRSPTYRERTHPAPCTRATMGPARLPHGTKHLLLGLLIGTAYGVALSGFLRRSKVTTVTKASQSLRVHPGVNYLRATQLTALLACQISPDLDVPMLLGALKPKMRGNHAGCSYVQRRLFFIP